MATGRILPLFSVLVFSMVLPAKSIEIHDSPMQTSIRPPPANLIFLMDDSESMAWEIFLEDQNQGLFHTKDSSAPFGFIFDSGGDKKQGSKSKTERAQTLSKAEAPYWQVHSRTFNLLYYDPAISYLPWPATAKYPELGDASLLHARIHPLGIETLPLLESFMEIGAEDENFCMVQDDAFAQFSGSGWEKVAYQEKTMGSQAFRGSFHRTASHDAKAVFSFELSATGKKEIRISWPSLKEKFHAITPKASVRVLDHAQRELANLFVDQKEVPEKIFTVQVEELNPQGPDLYLEFRPGSYGEESLLLVDKVTVGEKMTISNAHYLIVERDHEKKNPLQKERIFLVSFDQHLGSLHRKIHEIFPQDRLETGLLRGATLSDLPESLRLLYDPEYCGEKNPSFLSPENDLQNFSNWFQYYRNRLLVIQSGLVHLPEDFTHFHPGFHTLSGKKSQPVIRTDPHPVVAREKFLDALYEIQANPDFLLHEKDMAKGLETVGKYLATDLSPENTPELKESPYFSEEEGGACQQAFVFLLTDARIEQKIPPEKMVQTAREFYERDLAPDLDDLLAHNGNDTAPHQHMVTCVLVFNTQDPMGDTSATSGNEKKNPFFLAASAGKGLYRAEERPETIPEAMHSILLDMEARVRSGAMLQSPGNSLQEGNFFYLTEFNPMDWSGDLKAFSLNSHAGASMQTTPLWSAAQKLASVGPDRRVIVSALGTQTFPFRAESIPPTLREELAREIGASSTQDVNTLISHIRRGNTADKTLASGLGDMVNATPVYHRGVLYVGANDGMLHAFKGTTGKELFALIPSFVYPALRHRTRKDYADHHHYFVDGPVTIKTVSHEGKIKDILVGGLGKGGKGYYAMVLRNGEGWEAGEGLTESALASGLETWEFPPPGNRNFERDMGFSYSKVAIVRSALKKHPWIAVFGNGYNSASEEAVLFILDARTGEEIRRIRTGAGKDNGLSSPAIVDTNGDGRADRVYAGDLKGNLWKFDISSSRPEDWDVFWGGSPQKEPLFTGKSPTGAPQAVTGKPAIVKHCSGTGYMVLWGTGKYLGLPDLDDSDGQTLYGVWDYGGKASGLGTLDRRENTGHLYRVGKKETSDEEILYLVRQKIETANFPMEEALEGESGKDVFYPVASHSRHPQAYTWKEKGKSLEEGSTVGWFFDFPETGERMVQDALIHGSAVLTLSFVPSCIASPCKSGGHSWIHALDVCSGSRMPRAFFDINMDSVLENAHRDGEGWDHGDALVASGMGYEISRLKLPATILFVGIFAGPGLDCLLLLDLYGKRMLPLGMQEAKDGIFYWRLR